MNRGDVVLVRFPHPSGLRGNWRPAVVVQSDAYTGVVSTVIVAEVTKNLTMANDLTSALHTHSRVILFISRTTQTG
jgi:mRNA-degrading endonuclease toxin of MazEF toxin-antitoxin module